MGFLLDDRRMQHTAQDAARVTSLFMILVIASLINMFAVKISTQKFQEGNSLPHDLIIFTVYVLIGNALLSIATARFCTKEAESSVVTVSASPMSFLRILIAGGLRACISLCGTSMLFFAPHRGRERQVQKGCCRDFFFFCLFFLL